MKVYTVWGGYIANPNGDGEHFATFRSLKGAKQYKDELMSTGEVILHIQEEVGSPDETYADDEEVE